MNPSELAWNQGQTPPSAAVNAALMERVLYEVKRVVVGQDAFLERILVAILAQGHLLIATTHTHACYTLPRVIQQFCAAYPRVQLSLREGTPAQCCEIVATAGADIAMLNDVTPSFKYAPSQTPARVAASNRHCAAKTVTCRRSII